MTHYVYLGMYHNGTLMHTTHTLVYVYCLSSWHRHVNKVENMGIRCMSLLLGGGVVGQSRANPATPTYPTPTPHRYHINVLSPLLLSPWSPPGKPEQGCALPLNPYTYCLLRHPLAFLEATPLGASQTTLYNYAKSDIICGFNRDKLLTWPKNEVV